MYEKVVFINKTQQLTGNIESDSCAAFHRVLHRFSGKGATSEDGSVVSGRSLELENGLGSTTDLKFLNVRT